jgi:hypothetical protein
VDRAQERPDLSQSRRFGGCGVGRRTTLYVLGDEKTCGRHGQQRDRREVTAACHAKQCKLAVPVGAQAARLLARQAYETRAFLGVGTPAPIEGSAADRDEWGLGDLETLGMRA